MYGEELCLEEMQTCSWTPGIRGTWFIFKPTRNPNPNPNPNPTPTPTPLAIDYDRGIERKSPHFDEKIVDCKPIIYIYNSSEGGHYFLIEPNYQNIIVNKRLWSKQKEVPSSQATGSSSPSANALLNQQKAVFQKLEQMKSNRLFAEQLQSKF